MTIENDLKAHTSTLLRATWSTRDGQVVPKTEDVVLANGGVWLDEAVVLYADLFDSTTLAQKFTQKMAAKIIRAYLSSMTRLIRHNGGAVRSFDGDRVMGVFVGKRKNSAAAECALNMDWVVEEVLRSKAEAKFSSSAKVTPSPPVPGKRVLAAQSADGYWPASLKAQLPRLRRRVGRDCNLRGLTGAHHAEVDGAHFRREAEVDGPHLRREAK